LFEEVAPTRKRRRIGRDDMRSVPDLKVLSLAYYLAGNSQ